MNSSQQISHISLAHIGWHAHQWTNNCSPGIDFSCYLKLISPKHYSKWERIWLCQWKYRPLLSKEWSMEQQALYHQGEIQVRQSVRSHPTPTESKSVFAQGPPDDSSAHSSLRSTDCSTKKGERMLGSSNSWLLHRFPCDGVKLILTAFSIKEITKWVEHLSFISLNVFSDK